MIGYDISIVLISSADSAVSEWNIDSSTDQLLLPFLEHKDIKKIANFTISSQVIHISTGCTLISVNYHLKYNIN